MRHSSGGTEMNENNSTRKRSILVRHGRLVLATAIMASGFLAATWFASALPNHPWTRQVLADARRHANDHADDDTDAGANRCANRRPDRRAHDSADRSPDPSAAADDLHHPGAGHPADDGAGLRDGGAADGSGALRIQLHPGPALRTWVGRPPAAGDGTEPHRTAVG